MDGSVQRHFGQKMRELRKKQGLSQMKLAERSGLHFTYLSSTERGERNISLKNIVRIAKALGVKAEKLLEGIR